MSGPGGRVAAQRRHHAARFLGRHLVQRRCAARDQLLEQRGRRLIQRTLSPLVVLAGGGGCRVPDMVKPSYPLAATAAQWSR